MKPKSLVVWPLALSLAVLACSVFSPGAAPTPTLAPVVASDTAAPAATTAAPPATDTASAPPTDTAAPPPTDTVAAPGITDTPVTPAVPAQQFIAYLDTSRQLLVTDVTGGVLGGTTQYSRAGVEGEILEFAWSPSGEYIAFVSIIAGDPHIFVVYAIGAGTPLDLGNGTSLAWSPDSTRVAFYTEFNLWQRPIDGLSPRQQLTFNGDEWRWGRPTYTPFGEALLAGGALTVDMGAQGNTSFWLYTIPMDGSGTLTQLPGLASPIDGRLPQDLDYSPNSALLAFSTSLHFSACASKAEYFVMNADGSDRRGVISPALITRASDAAEIYFFGADFAWTPDSDGLLQSGLVRNCGDFSGDLVGDPQLSVVTLAGDERSVIIGQFDSLSFDRSASLIAAVQRADNASPGQVRLFNLIGNLVLTVGPGERAKFQP